MRILLSLAAGPPEFKELQPLIVKNLHENKEITIPSIKFDVDDDNCEEILNKINNIVYETIKTYKSFHNK